MIACHNSGSPIQHATFLRNQKPAEIATCDGWLRRISLSPASPGPIKQHLLDAKDYGEKGPDGSFRKR